MEMLDRNVRLARPQPQDPAQVSAARETWIERQRTVDQCHHGANVLAEIGQRESGMYQDYGIVACDFESTPGQIDALPKIRFAILALVVIKQPMAADRGPGECRSVKWIALDPCSSRRSACGTLAADDKTIAAARR